jgi:polysaccharide biosynthesis transport protein
MNTPQTPPVVGETGSRIGVRFYRYRAILKRYWWILAITVGLGLLYEGWVLFNKPERFVSIAKLRVTEVRSDQSNLSLIMDSSWYGTVCEMIKSPVVLERAGKRAVMQKPEFESLIGSVEIRAENEPGTHIFSISGVGRNPEFTKYFTGMVMEAFMEQRKEEISEGQRNRVSDLGQTNEKERIALEQAQEALTQFKTENNIVFVEEERQRIADEMSAAKKDREDLTQQLNTYRTLDDGSILKSGGARQPGEKDPGSSDWIETQKQLAIAEAELNERRFVWKPAHFRLQALEKQVEQLKLELDVLRTEATKGRKAAITRIEAELDTKTKAIADIEAKARNFTTIAGKYDSLKSEFDRREAQFKATRARLDDLAVGGTSSEILGVHQPASIAAPEQRNVLRHLLTGLVGGLLLGLVILFILDRADDRLASSSEMIEQFAEPILGQIPDVKDSRTEFGLPLLQTDDERFMYAEAFRSLRSSLIFMPNQTELKTLIVTSAIPNEGKSTIASNLAITMSNAGARVLLVDADLRRGDIATLFDTDGRQGLSNILRGEVLWKNCVQPVRDDRLHIIPRGPVTNQSGELLLLPILSKLLDEWKSTYDLVIFNTAPILATDDTPTVAPNFDGTLMVIRASFTSARLTRNSLNALYHRQVNVLGLILNCVDTELPDYYYYRYPKYYAA